MKTIESAPKRRKLNNLFRRKVELPEIDKPMVRTLESYYLATFDDVWDNRPTPEEKIQAQRDRWFQALCLNAHTVTQH